MSNPIPGQGETFTVRATSTNVGGSVTFQFNGQVVTAAVINGVATATFTGPTPGSYTGTAQCDDLVGTFTVTVPRGGGSTASTGSDAPLLVGRLGVGAVGLGLALWLVARRRRRDDDRHPVPA